MKYDRLKIMSEFAACRSIVETARRTGASRQTVANIVQGAGLCKKKPAHHPLNLNPDHVRHLYENENMSTSEIASFFGCGSETVRHCMKKSGIDRRSHGSQPGEKNHAWNGGRALDKSGYVLLHRPGHPDANSNGYIREHRLVMAEKLGRRLGRSEVVHHIDGNRQNNSPDNLELYACNADHLRSELVGRVPRWTPAGKAKMDEAAKIPKRQNWTPERKQAARDRMLARWRRGEIRPYQWSDERREQARARATTRRRNPDGSFAGNP